MSESDSDGTSFDAQMKVSKIAETLSTKNIELSKQVASLRRKLADLQKSHAEERLNLESTIKQLQQQRRELGEVSDQLSDLKSHADLQTLYQALSARYGQPITDLPGAIDAISRRDPVFDAVSSHSGADIRSIDSLLCFIDALTKRADSTEIGVRRDAESRARIRELENETATLRKQLDTLPVEDNSKSLLAEIERQNNRIASLERENAKLRAIEGDFVDYKVLFHESEKENERLKKAVRERPVERARIAELERENEDLNAKLSECLRVERTEPVTITVRARESRESVPLESKIRIAEYETRIRELEFEVQELRRRGKEMEVERGNQKDIEEERNEEVMMIDEAIETFGKCADTNNEMIEMLTTQKALLSASIERLFTACEVSEDFLKQISHEKSELVARIEELEQEIDTKEEAHQLETQELIEEIAQMLPNDLEFPDVEEPKDQVLEVMKMLLKRAEPKTQEKKPHSDAHRELMLLTQLDKALCFIRAFATSNLDLETSIFGEKEITRIVQEVARIQKLVAVDGVEIPAAASLFTDDSPEAQMKIFADFARGEDALTTPIKELYSLFVLVVNVNALLFRKNRELARKLGHVTTKLEKSAGQLNESRDKLTRCSAIMRQITGNQDESADVVEMASDVLHEFTQLTEDNVENEKSIQSLSVVISEMERQNARLDMEENQEWHEKVKRLKARLQRYKTRLIEERKSRDKIAADAQKKVDDVTRKYQKALDDIEDIQRKVKKLKVYKERCVQLQAQVTGLEEERSTVDVELNMTKAENERLTGTIQSLNERLVLAKDSLNTQIEKYTKLKSEKQALQKYSTVTLREITEKNEGIQKGYTKRVQELEALLDQKTKEILKLRAERDECKASSGENKALLTKARLSEKVLSMKFAQASEQSQLQLAAVESQFNRKLEALKANYERKVDELSHLVIHARESISDVISETFGEVVDQKTGKSLDSLLSLLAKLLSKHDVKDCLAVRKSLQMNNQESVSALLDGYKHELSERENTIHELEESISRKESQTDELRGQCARMTNALADHTEWIKWATSIFHILNIPAPSSPEAMRMAIEDAIQASTGDRSVIKHLETLRQTKKLLTSATARHIRPAPSTRNEATIRALTLVLICANRLLDSTRA